MCTGLFTWFCRRRIDSTNVRAVAVSCSPRKPRSTTNPSWVRSCGYNALNKLATASYDPLGSGSQTQIGAYQFSYDGESRMASSTLNQGATQYSYDGEGRRDGQDPRPGGEGEQSAARGTLCSLPARLRVFYVSTGGTALHRSRTADGRRKHRNVNSTVTMEIIETFDWNCGGA